MDGWMDGLLVKNVSPFGRFSRTVSAAPDSVTKSNLPSRLGHDGPLDGLCRYFSIR